MTFILAKIKKLNLNLHYNKRISVMILMISGVTTIFWFTFLAPEMTVYSTKVDEKNEFIDKINSLENSKLSSNLTNTESKNVFEDNYSLQKQIPSARELENFLTELFILTNDNNISFNSLDISNEEKSSTDESLQKIAISLDLQGKHKNIVNLLNELYELDRFVNINEVNIETITNQSEDDSDIHNVINTRVMLHIEIFYDKFTISEGRCPSVVEDRISKAIFRYAPSKYPALAKKML